MLWVVGVDTGWLTKLLFWISSTRDMLALGSRLSASSNVIFCLRQAVAFAVLSRFGFRCLNSVFAFVRPSPWGPGPYFSHPPTYPLYETTQHNPRRVTKGGRSSRQRLAAFQDENGPRDRLMSVAVATRVGRGEGDLRHEDVPGGGKRVGEPGKAPDDADLSGKRDPRSLDPRIVPKLRKKWETFFRID
jgi:hypothetical protein